MKKVKNKSQQEPRKIKVIVDRSKEDKEEKGSLIKERKKYQNYMFKGHKIPQLLRGAHQHIFAASDKKVHEPYFHEYQTNDIVLSWGIGTAKIQIMKGKNKGKEINLGRLNDTDLRIWNCILKIARDQNFNKDFSNDKIKITRYEIARMMGIKSIDGKTYKMIKESLDRLSYCSTRLLITDKKSGEELLISLGGYLDEYALYDIRGRSKIFEKQIDLFSGERRYSYVKINKRRLEEIKGGYITKISFDLLLSKLSTPLSRNLYTILNVRDNQNPVNLSLETLKELTGQKDLRTSKILNAASELKIYHFLKDFHSYKNWKKVFFKFVINKNFYEEENKQFEIEHESDLYCKLVMNVLNLTLRDAKDKVIDEFDNQDIIKYLKFLVYELKKGTSIDNRLGWFLKAIRETWTLPTNLRKNWKNSKIISTEDMLNV